MDGMKNMVDLTYTCEYRAGFILDGEECRQSFLHCCNEMTNNKKEADKEGEQLLSRSKSILKNSIHISI